MSIDINKHLPNFGPQPFSFSATLRTADKICDYVPVISTVSNLTDIFQKAVVIPIMNMTGTPKNTYYAHLNNKSYIRCVLGAIPLLGNISLIIYDLDKLSKKDYIIRSLICRPRLLRALLEDKDDMFINYRFETIVNGLNPNELDEIILKASALIGINLDPSLIGNSSTMGVWDLPKNYREDWNFLKKALSQNPNLATSKRFWFGCLAYTQDGSFNEKAVLMDHFIKDNKNFYVDVLSHLLISKLPPRVKTDILKNKEFIKFACDKLSTSEKEKIIKASVSVSQKSVRSSFPSYLGFGNSEFLPRTTVQYALNEEILNNFDLTSIENMLDSRELTENEKLLLQHYIFQKGGSVKIHGFFEKIIQCNHDRVLDINFSANFWRSVYLNDPNIATKIPKLLSHSAFLIEAFLIDPQFLKNIKGYTAESVATQIFLEAKAKNLIDNLSIEHKRALALTYPRARQIRYLDTLFGFVSFPQEIYEELIQIGSSNRKEDLKIKENYFYSYIAPKNPIIAEAISTGVSIYFGKKLIFSIRTCDDECCLLINPDTFEPEWYAKIRVLKGETVVEEERRYPGTKNFYEVKSLVRDERIKWEARIEEHERAKRDKERAKRDKERAERERAEQEWRNFFRNQYESKASSANSSESQYPFVSILEMTWSDEKRKYADLKPDTITATNEYGKFKARFFTSKTPFELLDLPSKADPKSIKNAYRNYSLLLHPDKNKEKEQEATTLFQILHSAYEMIQK